MVMPGPCSKPNGTRRTVPQMVPPKLVARIAEWEKEGGVNAKSKTRMHKPGSQKK